MKRVVLEASGSMKIRLFSSAVSARTYPPKDIKITPAIKRSPTAVLEALAGTVGVDPTAPHFSFIDDPAMIPTTTAHRRNYYLSKELGKRAARQLAEEWPTLFAFDRDQPELPVFRPEKCADPLKVDPTEENLLKMIGDRHVSDAIMLYERMRTENKNVSQVTQNMLFHLVSYYNEKNLPFVEIEEWHGLRNYSAVEDSPHSLMPGGIVDLLFETIQRSPESVSTMIAALCKFSNKKNIKRAKQLYKEYLSQKFILRSAFDAIIRTSSWPEAKTVLSDMKDYKVQPTLNTWNSLLNVAYFIKEIDERREAFEEIIGEMNALEVRPSLTSYDIILKSALENWPEGHKTNSSPDHQSATIAVTWLCHFLTELESRPTIELESVSDSHFFNTSMSIASRANNLHLADKILTFYESDANKVKLPALIGEATFYDRYLNLYVENITSIEDIASKYRYYVPRLVGLSRNLASALCSRLEETANWPLLRRLIEDGISSRHMSDWKISDNYRRRLLAVHFESLNTTEREEYASLINRLINIAKELANFTEESQTYLQVKWHPNQIAQFALLLNRIGEPEKAYKLLELLLNEENKFGPAATVSVDGNPSFPIMLELFDDALSNQDVYRAAICLEVLSQFTSKNKLEQLASRIHNTCKLAEAQSRLIDSYVRLRPE